MNNFARVALVVGIVLCTPHAMAQPFPAKPIRIIVPTSPGGLNDLLSRRLGQHIAESVGQPVIVENRPGGGSMIGMAALAKSPPDGYTVGITTSEPLIYNPLLYTKLPYDAENDFSYVTQLVYTIGVIVANGAAPFNTFPEMVAYARANPGKLNWATWGAGSAPAVYLEWVRRQNGNLDIAAIPYKGAGPSIPAIVGGEVQLTYTGIGLTVQHLRSGKLKALAVVGVEKAAVSPGTPPLTQFNSDPQLTSGFAVYAPGRTPMPVQERLAAEFRAALKTPAVQKIMEGSMEPVGNTPAEFADIIKAARANAARVFKVLGLKPSEAPE